jgi:cytochrome c551/c552
MSTVVNVCLAIAFVVLAFGATLLMYHLWGYPFDHKTHRSSAPRWAMALHRLMGWAFVAIYVYLMIQMIPRMWSYQIELPARTVFHLVLGYGIGAVLIAKIIVVRFFKHLEAKLAPALGTTLFVLTIVLMGLALPSVWREQVLASQAMGGEGFSDERLQRVREQLPTIGYQPEMIDEMASRRGLFAGRELLRSKCVECHDLRTILARPRTAKNWRDTVERMVNRASIVSGFSDKEKWQITAYLIAITPTLQNSVMEQRKQLSASADSAAAIKKVSAMVRESSDGFDVAAAGEVFNSKCSLCHSQDLALQRTFASTDEVSQLVTRMVANGLAATETELEQVVRYLQDYHKLAVAPETAAESTVASTALPPMPELASVSGCASCHAIEGKLIGPGWKAVADRYRGDEQARDQLIQVIKVGGSGNWTDLTGGVPMPGHSPRVNDADTATLVDFILALP